MASFDFDYPASTVFGVPCAHLAAKDGLFYCIPSYYNDPQIRGHYIFIMADTAKMIVETQQSTQQIFKHAERQTVGTTLSRLLSTTTPENPREMGLWSYIKTKGLVMARGEAAYLAIAQYAPVPCFPISIEKAWGPATIAMVRRKIEYTGDVAVKPIFKSQDGSSLPEFDRR